MSHLEINKLFSVEGMVAVITGGGSGLGQTMAHALAANGASKVYIIGRRQHKLTETASSNPETIIPVVGDVGSKDSLQSAYDTISASTGHIDLLVANSGVMGPPGMPQKADASVEEIREHLWSIPMEEFTQTAHVNVTGAFYTAVAFLPLLEAANKKRREAADAVGPNVPRPQIIVTTSIAGFMRHMNPTMSYAYSTSKAAANHLVKQLSTALAGHQIRVNGIAPGLYHSEMSLRRYVREGVGNKGLDEGSFAVGEIPLTRSGSEEDVAGVILWLAGRTGCYVNGNIVVSDGGRLGVHPATY